MGKKYKNLIEQIASHDNLMLAYAKTARGRRQTRGYLEFKEFAPVSLDSLRAEILSGSYRPGPPRNFYVFEPKRRLISAISFRDRVLQHALCNVVGRIFEAALLPRCFACRPVLGTHAAAKTVQADMRRLTADGQDLYFLKTDFSKYFASIDRATLWRLIEAKISCPPTLRLIEVITPRTGRGIPIGSLVSQYWANVFGGMLDRFLQQQLRQKHWARYMDDVVVLGFSPQELRAVKVEVERYALLEMGGLTLSKWSCASVKRGCNFVGYRIWPTHKLIRKQSVVTARRHLLRERDPTRRQKFIAAWTGHCRWADSHNLLKNLGIKDGNYQFPGGSGLGTPTKAAGITSRSSAGVAGLK